MMSVCKNTTASTVCSAMGLYTHLLLCSVLIAQSLECLDEPKHCDTCTRLACESGLIERLVRLEIENGRLNEKLALVEENKHADVSVKFRLSSDKSIKDGQRLMFDVPVFDNGNAYDAEKGEFMAPVTGMYSFVTTICLKPNTYSDVGLLRNGALIGRFLTGDNAYNTCNSENTVITLSQGDRVWVQKIRGSATTLEEEHGWNSFSVALIRVLP